MKILLHLTPGAAVLDFRGCARGPAKPEVAECDLQEGMTHGSTAGDLLRGVMM